MPRRGRAPLRGTRAAIIAVVVLALTGGVFAAWKLLVKPVQRPSALPAGSGAGI